MIIFMLIIGKIASRKRALIGFWRHSCRRENFFFFFFSPPSVPKESPRIRPMRTKEHEECDVAHNYSLCSAQTRVELQTSDRCVKTILSRMIFTTLVPEDNLLIESFSPIFPDGEDPFTSLYGGSFWCT